MTVIEIFQLLESDNSRLFKEDVLRKNSKDEELKESIRLALDNFTQFYIRKIPKYTPNSANGETLSWAFQELKKLSSRQVTGNAGIDHLKFILENVTSANALVVERIIKKDLRCGVSTATANKIWKNLIPEYPIMLASGFNQKLIDEITWPAIAQLKLDGMRANIVVKDGQVSVYSRNGKPIDLLGYFDSLFIKMAGEKNVVFDCELLATDSAGKFLDRQTGNGILNKAVKGTISSSEVKSVHFVLFDIIPYEFFVKGLYKVPYFNRYRDLCSAYEIGSSKSSLGNSISVVPSREVSSITQATRYFEEMLAAGQEGIILKDTMSIWEGKRSKQQIKFKGELDCDLICVGWELGTGKNSSRLGNLLLESSDGVVKVSVGSGFSDEQRDTFGDNVVGKIVAVRYNARIKDRSGNESLFLPRFLEVREDKDEADNSKDIK